MSFLCSIMVANSEKNNTTMEDSDEIDEIDLSGSEITRGKPKSGKFWKSKKQRAASMIKTHGLKISLQKKNQLRRELLEAKQRSRELKEERVKAKEDHKLRRRTNLKKKEENSKKSEIVQVIRDTTKIKRLKKKHLSMIVKRDTLIK